MGETSLCQAIFYGDIYTVEILIARGANPLARSRDALVGLTPSGASDLKAFARMLKKPYDGQAPLQSRPVIRLYFGS